VAPGRRNILEARIDEPIGLFHIAGDQFGTLFDPKCSANLPDRAGGVLQVSVEQQIGHAGLLLDTLC